MKKWFLRISGVLFLVAAILATIVTISEYDKTLFEKYTRNESLPTIKTDWLGTPVDENGRFMNDEFPFLPSFVGLLKWKLGTNPQEQEKQNDTFRLKVQDPTKFLSGDKDGILWLGHASVLIRLEGKVILLDPVFGEPTFIDRYVEVPPPLDRIGRVDYVLTSHDHRDHLDEPTIREISRRFPAAKFFAGLGSEDLLTKWTGDETRVQTAGWYQQFELGDTDLKITFVPVRHWSRRGPFDTNERLWGGYIIEGAEKTIYHGGDSGYGTHYARMAETFPAIDYFIIGIGSYSPRWFMTPNHNNPEDAVQAFIDSKAKFLVPMHYATFNMTDEPPGEPLRRLRENAAELKIEERVKPLDIYESIVFE